MYIAVQKPIICIEYKVPIRLVVCSGAKRGVEGAYCIFYSVYGYRVAVYKMEIVATSSGGD